MEVLPNGDCEEFTGAAARRRYLSPRDYGGAAIDPSLFVGWLGLLIGLAGLVASVVSYRRSVHKAPKPVYVVTGRQLARSQPHRGIAVSYQGEEIDAVQQVHVAFWNAGGAPMRREDVPDNAPIAFRFPQGVHVLEASVVKASNEGTQAGCSVIGGRTVELHFHHFDANEGALVEVLHGGPPAIPTALGKVIGASAGMTEIQTPLWDDPGGHKPMFVIGWALSVLATALGLIAILTLSLEWAALAVVSGVAAGFSYLMARSSYRKDVRFLPAEIRPPPHNILRMMQDRADQAARKAVRATG